MNLAFVNNLFNTFNCCLLGELAGSLKALAIEGGNVISSMGILSSARFNSGAVKIKVLPPIRSVLQVKTSFQPDKVTRACKYAKRPVHSKDLLIISAVAYNYVQLPLIIYMLIFMPTHNRQPLDLSVIIVNYNVKFLLEQCLCSVSAAINGLPAEIFVVDNASTDGSIPYLEPRFPTFHFIQNEENTGFARANNLALARASGKYILFLNPDTVVPEDCFLKSIRFLEERKEAGALGVKMINGQGRFLKESKRGFPSPLTSFWKMTGLIGLFPRSKTIARYYLGHLGENETHAVDALSGAFMLVKKEVLDKTGGFDEQFFMYAEDIDLSYRIIKQGYQNFYFPQTVIVHYKGESAQKDQVYVNQFYKAMSQFVSKYFTKSHSGLFIGLLNAAIWFKKTTEGIRRTIRNRYAPAPRQERVYLQGDEEGIREQEAQLLLNPKKTLTKEKGQADTIILCQGDDFPVARLIGYMQAHPGPSYRIRIKGCSA